MASEAAASTTKTTTDLHNSGADSCDTACGGGNCESKTQYRRSNTPPADGTGANRTDADAARTG
ncbi:MAG: hypothetical protein ACI9HI_000473, partial [Salinirussus sp.]